MKHLLSYILITLLTVAANAGTISVNSQQDFDALSGKIVDAIKQGERDIIVNINVKELTFADKQVSLKSIKQPEVSIAIHGNGVRIVSKGRMVKELKDPSLMYLKNGGYYNPWTPFRQLDDTISVTDLTSHQCRIKTSARNKKDAHPQHQYINYTCWYTSRTSPVTRVGRNWIEFDGGDWAVPQKGHFYNVNMDYSYAKKYPRYRLFGTERLAEEVYQCEASTLLNLSYCDLRSFSIDGINVTGSSCNGPLIMVDLCKAHSILITNSTFRCIGGSILIDRKSTNVSFTHNRVDTFMGYGIQSEAGSTGTRVTNNTFTNCTLGMEIGFAIQMRSDGFLVSQNTITDFCFGAIGAGIWGGTTTDSKCRGVISDNEIYLSATYLSDLMQHTLMDSGAIYTWTRCDGVTISNNYIHDISGIRDNRGIFCDDGTRNVTVTGNRIERIHNSYDIDLRWCDTYKEKVPDHNTGNTVKDNNTTGRVRFETKRP